MDGHRLRAGRSSLLALALATGLLLAAGPGCDLASFLEDLGLTDGAGELTGQNAFVHLRARASVASKADTDAVLEVLAWRAEGAHSTEDEAQFRPRAEVLDLLQATARQRKSIRPRSFALVAFPPLQGGQQKAFKAAFRAPDLSRLRNEYVIPNLNAIPVRNQGSRGTCAAFTGIGHVEYAALRANPGLRTLDLSEQRFYWASKPECHATGCTEEDAGSWYGDGFQASIDARTYDIPLEASCPYDPNQYRNELQTPLRSSCSQGVVQVKRVEIVYQPDEMIRVLEEKGLPVPFASPLSDNYFENDGLITLAAAGRATGMHAGGHAYLLVGYRLLPNMPQEGGLCFIVKNSWGPGWGVNGYSCITLAWMQEWNFGMALDHPVVVDIALSPDLGGDAYDDSVPDFADCEVYADETIDCDRVDDNANVPPAPEPPADLSWYQTSLVGPDGRLYEAEIADDRGASWVRGTLRETGALTGAIYLLRNGDDLLWDGDVVGRVNGDRIQLCTGPFDLLCSLRFEANSNDLYVEFVYREYRSVKQDEIGQGQWMTLGALPGVGENLEFHQPDDWTDLLLKPLYVRGLTGGDGGPSDPIRLVLRGLDIKAMGQQVGSLDPTNLGLCTGSFRNACGLFSGGNRLHVLPTW
jgi:C1A family cysteine protease